MLRQETTTAADAFVPEAWGTVGNSTTTQSSGLVPSTNTDAITIRPCPLSIYDNPYTLKPCRLIPRAQLPLIFLDPISNTTSIPATRFFTGNIPSLNHVHNANSEPLVLVASILGEHTLFVVEPVQLSVYALCRLASWVTLELIINLKHRDRDDIVPMLWHVDAGQNCEWWQRASLKRSRDSEIAEERAPSKRFRLRVVEPQSKRLRSETDGQERVKITQTITPKGNRSPLQEVDGNAQSSHTAEEMYESLVLQYLETLYSPRPLAFFAKGPLSRARAAFGDNASPDFQLSELIAFLRSMVLKPDVMTKKFKERLPELIRCLPIVMGSDDEGQTPLVSTKKRKKSKKPKLGREGTYSQEIDYIRRWWSSRDASRGVADTTDTAERRMKQRLADLQTRETLAQIIVILEILALEETHPNNEARPLRHQQSQEPGDCNSNQSKSKSKSKKPKKPQDLQTLLELLMDKLSIWQSIESIAETNVEDHRVQRRGSMGKPADKDLLAAFCGEVVEPFYRSRLPRVAESLSQKFIGDTAAPDKPMSSRRRQESVAEMGTNTSHALKHPRRSLARATSDIGGLARGTSLVRSATDSSLLKRIKREPSELSIGSVPGKDFTSRASREPSVQLKHLNRRQVNLNALAAATQEKLKKKAKVEEELRNAISTLRKPNRAAAIKELADAEDIRTTGGGRRGGRQAVQVGATPSHTRVKHCILQPTLENSTATLFTTQLHSSPVVLASASRPPPVRSLAFSQPVFNPETQDVITATPSKGLARKSHIFATPSKHSSNELTIPSSASARMSAAMSRPASDPTRNARAPLTAFASIPARLTVLEGNSINQPGDDTSAATNGQDRLALSVVLSGVITGKESIPAEVREVSSLTVESRNEICDSSSGEKSIYDALGWNNDGVDELAC